MNWEDVQTPVITDCLLIKGTEISFAGPNLYLYEIIVFGQFVVLNKNSRTYS